MKINVVETFTETPGGRTRADGEFSGQEFRETILNPIIDKILETQEELEIDLDGGYGYGSSFLEEVFGGMIRELKFKKISLNRIKDLKKRIFIKSDDEPVLIRQIDEYMEQSIADEE